MPLGKTPILQSDTMAQADNNKYLLFNNAIVKLEDSVQRANPITVAGNTTITLTETQFLNFGVQLLSGATGAFTLNVPNTIGNPAIATQRLFAVINSAGHTVTVKNTTGSGAQVQVPNNQGLLCYTDGTNVTAVAGAGVGANTLTIQDGTSDIVANAAQLAFDATPFTVTNPSGSRALVALAAGYGNIPLQNASTQVLAAPQALDFVGNGVTASANGQIGTVTVPGTTISANGTPLPGPTTPPTNVNFVNGSGTTVSLVDDLDGTVTLTVNASTASVPVQDEGGQVVAAPTALNFVGAGVTASDVSGVATITIPGGSTSKATTSQIRTGTADVYIDPQGIDNAQAYVPLTDSATISLDINTGRNFTVTLGGNRTLAAPTNATVGRSGTIEVVQDATGSRTLTFDTVYKFVGGTAPTLTTVANNRDFFAYHCRAANYIVVTHIGSFPA